ncbi:5-hydroxytryptamine receptor 3A-like [Dendropsophus ebraccatus]|uniref:5-hydroxytryptamine receptor 3A-like n=1 Tax=Dendropsophus ebraccatus TaxID=150705 RepID=UPI0038314B71
MDFVTDLPPSAGNTVIWVVTDRFSKMSQFVALPGLPSAPRLAQLFFQHIFRLHGTQETSNFKHSNTTEVHLFHSLMNGYEAKVRPVQHWKKSISVHIDITIYAILSVDEKNQLLTTHFLFNRYWKDEFLHWNPEDFDNMTIISIPKENIWVPDIMIREFVDSGKPLGHSFVYIKNTGLIKYHKTNRVSTMCMFHIYFFPFDVHNCTLSFRSQLHTTEHINMSAGRTTKDMKKELSKFYNQGEWELVNVYPSYGLETDGEEKFAVLRFHIIFKRHPLYYVVNLIIPSILLMILDIIGFYLPIESGERITFKITLLLGYSVFLIIVTETLPASAHTTPIIDSYFLVCMALLTISLMESIFIVRIVSKKNIKTKVPKWIKRLVLEKLSILVCMKDKNWPIKPTQTLPDTLQDMETTSNDELTKYTENSETSTQTPAVIKERTEILEGIFNEVVTIRQYIKHQNEERTSKEWLLVGYVLDKFLFWLYLITVMAYTVTLTICWSYHIAV